MNFLLNRAGSGSDPKSGLRKGAKNDIITEVFNKDSFGDRKILETYFYMIFKTNTTERVCLLEAASFLV